MVADGQRLSEQSPIKHFTTEDASLRTVWAACGSERRAGREPSAPVSACSAPPAHRTAQPHCAAPDEPTEQHSSHTHDRAAGCGGWQSSQAGGRPAGSFSGGSSPECRAGYLPVCASCGQRSSAHSLAPIRTSPKTPANALYPPHFHQNQQHAITVRGDHIRLTTNHIRQRG